MIAAVQLKRHMAGAQVLCVIISKLGHWYELGPVILLEIYEGSEVCFHGALLLLSLAVSLREKSGRKPPFNAEEVAAQ